MSILLTAGSVAQLVSVLIIFVLVLGVTAWVTRWMANYQKEQGANSNVEIMETVRITNNKYIQLVRAGETYKVIAVCKDTVTFLGDVPADQLHFRDASESRTSFRKILEEKVKRNPGDQSEAKDEGE